MWKYYTKIYKKGARSVKKSNFIKNIGVLLSDKSRLAASAAKSIKESDKTIYSNVIFTKCKSCKKRTDKSVMWKLKAKKATHLKKSKSHEKTSKKHQTSKKKNNNNTR